MSGGIYNYLRQRCIEFLTELSVLLDISLIEVVAGSEMGISDAVSEMSISIFRSRSNAAF